MASSGRLSAPRAGIAIVALVLLIAGAGLPSAALAAPDDDLVAAQSAANRAAGELADAQEQLARSQDAVTHLQGRVAAVDARVGLARTQLMQLAIRLYVQPTTPVVRILRMGDANDVIRAQQYSHVIAGGSTDALRRFRVERDDLRRELTALEREQESHAESLENLDQRRADAIAEIDRLGQVVARAEAAREAERQAESAAAEASSAARSTPGGPAATSPAGAPVGPATSAPSATGADSGVAPVVPDAPEPDEPAPEVVSPAADWICPVQGPHAFSDDYGAPRGGGYSHEGTDLLAARGTPVVASVAGEVRHRSGAVSGLAYYLDGDDGNEYFGAHLDSYGASGRVSAGTVVGTVGNTGDAASTAPHLHFEIHPGGTGNINPFPKLSAYC